MLGDIGKKLLIIMGQSGIVPGAIVADDIPQALSMLELGIKDYKQTIPHSTKQDDEEKEPEISLDLRAYPLIGMLKAAMKHHCHVMWE